MKTIVKPLFFKSIILFSLCVLSITSFAQESNSKNNTNFILHKKGSFYINWGYNRSWFNKSDIHFKGQGHDFVLYDVKAKDRPSDLSLDYINPKTWSIPQFNFRFGYQISNKYSVSVGWDHMKYVAVDFQSVKMSGFVDPANVSDLLMKSNMQLINSKYSTTGEYNKTEVEMTPNDFIHYEHTDGLNYAFTEIERKDNIWQFSKYNKLAITLISGVGGGLIIPRTDAHLFGSGRNHFWNIAGWGADAKVGLQLNLSKHIYLESGFKYGYLQMIKVHTSN